MVGETNAAIEGALAGGATDVLVNDSHWNMYNLLPGGAPPGGARPPGPEGLVDGRRRAAGPGTPASTSRCSSATTPAPAIRRGTIAHTYSGAPVETRLDGRPTGEYGFNAARRSAPGASRSGWSPATTRSPTRSRAGCRGPSGSWSRTADGGHSAISVHPTVAARAGARRRRASGPSAPPPASCSSCASIRRSSSRSTTRRGVEADFAAIVPGAERVGDRGVRYTSDDPVMAYPRVPRRQPAGRHRRLSAGPYSGGNHQLPGARDRASRPLGGARDPAAPASPPARPRRPHRQPAAGPDRLDRRRRRTSGSGTRRSGATSRRRPTGAAWPGPG